MTDDNGDDVQKHWRIVGIDKAMEDLPSQLHKDIWNRAIDKCIEYLSYNNLDQNNTVDIIEIRKLKV